MQPTETLLIKFTLDGSQIEGAVQVPAGSVPKKAILPVLRQLTDSVVSIATQTVEQGGDRIACHKGCDACCRQMVPLAPTEIFGLAEVLERMSAPLANRILQKFDEAIDALEQKGILERLRERAALSASDVDQLDRDYFLAQVACPFLEKGACVIHGERPLACREFLVTSDPRHCRTQESGKVKRVEMPAKISVGLSESDKPEGWVPLVLAREFMARRSETKVNAGEALRAVLGQI